MIKQIENIISPFIVITCIAALCIAADTPGTTPGKPGESRYTLEYRGPLHTNDVTPKVEARLQWVTVTNWVTSPVTHRTLMGWSGDHDPNVTTYFEIGTISSNLIAVVDWKGQPKSVLLESIIFNTTERAYTLKTTTERVYR